VMAFLLCVHPYAFVGFEMRLKVLRFLTIFLFNAVFPAFAVFLMWRLQLFVQSVYLRTAKERIVPYVIAMIFYWWTCHVFKNLPDTPPVAVHFLFGSFLALFGSWMCNIYFKVSMHAVAMGGALLFFLLFSFGDSYTSGLYLSTTLLLTGLVCTARLVVSGHSPFEVYAGLFVGMLGQFIAWYWLGGGIV